MSFIVSVKVKGNKLTGKALGDFTDGDRFYCYLLRYGKVVERVTTWQGSNTFVWSLGQAGLYSVQLHLKRGNENIMKLSKPVRYFTEEDSARFEKQVVRIVASPPPELALYRPTFPFQNLCLIYKPSASESFLEVNGLGMASHGCKFGDGFCQLISDATLDEFDDNKYAFSGMLVRNGELIFGRDEAKSIIGEIDDEVGTYAIASVGSSGARIGVDYFSVNKIYFYQGAHFVASNSYHLLIMILASLGEKLWFDKRRVRASLSYVNMQFFHQSFTRLADIKGIEMLSIDKSIVIDSGGVNFVDKAISEPLNKKSHLSATQYQGLMKLAAQEVEDNVEAALKHPRFSKVILDLSGGMDSRAVFCAATRIQNFGDKVKINSQNVPSEPLDLEVALSLASMYECEYDDLPTERKAIPGSTLWDQSWSYNLGNYYSYVPVSLSARVKSAIRLVGFYGEICARPYYSRSYLSGDLDVEDSDEFVTKYLDKFAHMSLVAGDTGCAADLASLFADELRRLPGESALEKLESHYLAFRNGLHCSGTFRNDISCPEWGPLMSKSLFKAKLATFSEFKSIKVQLDLMNMLNPIVASHVYQSEKDNLSKKQVLDQQGLLNFAPYMEALTISVKSDRKRWEAAAKLKKVAVIDRLSDADAVRYRTADSERDSLFLNALAYILHRAVIDRNVAIDLFMFFENFRSQDSARPQVWSLVNKVMSIAYQCSIITR